MQKQKIFSKLKMPHGYVIIILLLIAVCLMTYIVPAGSYDKIKNEQTGQSLVDPNSYHSTGETNPVSPLMIPTLIVKSISQQNILIFSVILIAGALEVILATGMFHAFCNRLSKFCANGGRERLFIPGIMMIFTILGLTQSTDKFIGFAPIGVMLAMSMGYDAVVGVAMVLLGVGLSFSAGAIHSTTAIAQSIVGLAPFSGMGYRFVVTAVLYVITTVYIYRYAMRVKANPAHSVVYQVDGIMAFNPAEADVQVEKRHYGVLAAFIIGLIVIMVGCAVYSWEIIQVTIAFVWVGMICGLLYGFGPSKICQLFIKGAGGATGAALVVGLGSAVSLVLSTAGIIDTVVMALSGIFTAVPQILRAPVMYLVNVVINFFIPSANGQAVVVLPILGPLGDIVEVSRQNTVLSFKLGDGLCNYILPHASALMGFLGITGIPYDKWMRFMWKLFVWWLIVGCVMCGIAGVIGY